MSRKANTGIFLLLKSTLASPVLKETFRRANKDFTRDRKMPFPKVVLNWRERPPLVPMPATPHRIQSPSKVWHCSIGMPIHR